MSATDSDVPFDPDTVCDRVTQRVNELWQNAVINSIRYGPDLCDLQIPRRRILRGAWELRCALEDGISEIRTTSGLLGEHLDKRPFINSPGGDPNWKMANAVINTWKKLFFEPQRDNVERLIAGLRMATRNAGSQDHAVRLLDQFKESTILPDYLAVRGMVEQAIDLIQVTPLDVDPNTTQQPGDGQPESTVLSLEQAAKTIEYRQNEDLVDPPAMTPTKDEEPVEPKGDKDLDQMMSHPAISDRYGITDDNDRERLRKTLEYWRMKRDNFGSPDWAEVENRKPTDPKYLFRLRAVKHILDGFKKTQFTAVSPAKKN